MSVDIQNRKVLIFLDDGTLASAPIPDDFQVGWEHLAKSEVDLDAGELALTLTGGTSVRLDLGWPGAPVPSAPVAYLDQNHWITLARATYAPDRLDPRTREAANELIDQALAGTIRLPFSAGHVVETVPRGHQRRDVAMTMLSLSRGLQMRNPLQVRAQELAAAIMGREPRCEHVFTTEPKALFTEPRGVTPPKDFPAVWQELHRRMSETTATVAVMLGDDGTPEPAGPRERWLDGYRRLAAEAHSKPRTPEQSRDLARAALLSDFRDEAISAARAVDASASEFKVWIDTRSEADFERAPHLSTLLELLYHRLRNRDDLWARNDLIDMHFLSCAGGYADMVVAERKFAEYLRRARRRRPGNAVVAATLAEALESLTALAQRNDDSSYQT